MWLCFSPDGQLLVGVPLRFARSNKGLGWCLDGGTDWSIAVSFSCYIVMMRFHWRIKFCQLYRFSFAALIIYIDYGKWSRVFGKCLAASPHA